MSKLCHRGWKNPIEMPFVILLGQPSFSRRNFFLSPSQGQEWANKQYGPTNSARDTKTCLVLRQ
jgi:hypothetical protein